MRLSVLLGENAYRLQGNAEILEQEIDLVTADPSRARPGSLLVCTQTALHNGYRSAEAAYTVGCRAFLTDRPLRLPPDAAQLTVPNAEALLGRLAAGLLGEPARRMTVIGVSGTAGKTSVVHLLTALLEDQGRRVASLTSDGVRFGTELRPAGRVVPNAADLQCLLAELERSGAEVVILELSAYMLAHKTAFSIPFAAVLLTNLSVAHVGHGEFASVADYHAAKRSLLALDAPLAVIPAGITDLPLCQGRTVTFGAGGDVYAEAVRPVADRAGLGSSLELCLPNGEKHCISLPVPGDIAVGNALAAAALATALGVKGEIVARVLSTCRPTGRMECLATCFGRYVFSDAAFEADSLKRALDTLRPYTKGRLTVLVGSVGGRAVWRREA
ncbi:MAG: hypothetical protein IKM08_03185, partial [Clostridia bacterium]|nr:hypothetical protein [Clostridia bacterium]